MGKGGGSVPAAKPVAVEEPVAPAVAQDAQTADENSENQSERRSRLRGIRSTYHRFAAESGGGNGTKSKLG